MTESYLRHQIVNEKISKIVAPLVIIYMFWLMMSVMFNLEAFMVSVAIQFVVIGIFALVELLVVHPHRKP